MVILGHLIDVTFTATTSHLIDRGYRHYRLPGSRTDDSDFIAFAAAKTH